MQSQLLQNDCIFLVGGRGRGTKMQHSCNNCYVVLEQHVFPLVSKFSEWLIVGLVGGLDIWDPLMKGIVT